jgi:hypothetical protein
MQRVATDDRKKFLVLALVGVLFSVSYDPLSYSRKRYSS